MDMKNIMLAEFTAMCESYKTELIALQPALNAGVTVTDQFGFQLTYFDLETEERISALCQLHCLIIESRDNHPELFQTIFTHYEIEEF